MKKIAYSACFAATVALTIASADLAAAPGRGMGIDTAVTMAAGMDRTMRPGATTPPGPAMDAGMRPPPNATGHPNADPPSPNEVLPPEEHNYRPVRLEVRKIIWFEPGQRGLIEAHPLVMGLAAMALATVTLLFFFLHGIKRPKDGDI